jgi:hypothetical protein
VARPTVIKRVVDALVSQRRVILHLECGHNESIPDLRFVHDPGLFFQSGDAYTCPYCATPATNDPRAESTPRDEFDALFKEPML